MNIKKEMKKLPETADRKNGQRTIKKKKKGTVLAKEGIPFSF